MPPDPHPLPRQRGRAGEWAVGDATQQGRRCRAGPAATAKCRRATLRREVERVARDEALRDGAGRFGTRPRPLYRGGR